MDCVFCKIANKKIASDIVLENEYFLAFKDINPKAPIHILIIPKNHIGPVSSLDSSNEEIIGKLILKAGEIAEKIGISKNGYRLIFNVGQDAGMEVDHLHLHLLAGKPLKFEICPLK